MVMSPGRSHEDYQELKMKRKEVAQWVVLETLIAIRLMIYPSDTNGRICGMRC